MRLPKIVNYAFSLFSPIILPLLVLIPGSILNITMALSMNEAMWPSILLLLVVTVLPLILIVCLYFLSLKFYSFRQRLVINYVAWLLLGSGAIYLCMSALGGVSMAAVEGVVSPNEFRVQVLAATSVVLLYSHIIILPVCYWGTLRTTKLFQIS